MSAADVAVASRLRQEGDEYWNITLKKRLMIKFTKLLTTTECEISYDLCRMMDHWWLTARLSEMLGTNLGLGVHEESSLFASSLPTPYTVDRLDLLQDMMQAVYRRSEKKVVISSLRLGPFL
jgi:hypothetical protein